MATNLSRVNKSIPFEGWLCFILSRFFFGNIFMAKASWVVKYFCHSWGKITFFLFRCALHTLGKSSIGVCENNACEICKTVTDLCQHSLNIYGTFCKSKIVKLTHLGSFFTLHLGMIEKVSSSSSWGDLSWQRLFSKAVDSLTANLFNKNSSYLNAKLRVWKPSLRVQS